MKLLLIVLDGFGYHPLRKNNAVAQARMPFYRSLLKRYPHTFLKASSQWVGLPRNTMGNSEVGHLTLGSGRILLQQCLRINQAIANKSFFSNATLTTLFEKARRTSRTVHIVGLLSDAGVHAHVSHLLALLALARKSSVHTYLHLFTDGRDMDPHSSLPLLGRIERFLAKAPSIHIATIAGRYFGMDRDKRWHRTKQAYDAIVHGKGNAAASARAAILHAYKRGESDEFVAPTIIGAYRGVQSGDSVFSFNFRADRARQLCWAFSKKNFTHFACSSKRISLATMSLYDPKRLVCPVAFPETQLPHVLCEVFSKHKLRQMHIAETEKYAHVTYFFNGGREKPFTGEERLLIPSPKVHTYDATPAMNAPAITKKTCTALSTEKYAFVLVNFANPDMVGHTGNFAATKEALRITDGCLQSLVQTAAAHKYGIALTSDHGNCEQMGAGLRTSHTQNKVPFVLILPAAQKGYRNRRSQAEPAPRKLRPNGSLQDVAPTLLELAGLPVPKEMTGTSLLFG